MRMIFLVLVLFTTAAVAAPVFATTAYFRYPDIHGDQIVFAAEADLWLVPSTGGTAIRLTTHPGTEYFPHFSPDGKWIAFSGQFDGNRDVFVIPTRGGEPRRLTWHPAPDEVIGWTPDGAEILFRSRREQPNYSYEVFTVPLDGGDAKKMPWGWMTRLDIDPDTGMWALNRKERERATWKRYRGGTAPNIWVGHPDRGDFREITTFAGADAFPMWYAGRIYFLSDLGGTVNIWSILPDGTERRSHTDFGEWDARWPAMGPDGRICFTLGADVHVFNPADNTTAEVEITLPSDRVLTRARYPDAQKSLTWFDLSPTGDRLVVVTRGEVFSVPVKEGVTLPVSHGSGARESWASFGPKGKRIIYVTDEPREEEIRTLDAWGRGEPTVVKKAGDSGWHFPPRISPDGEWVAFADQTQTLYVMPLKGGRPAKVDRSDQEEIRSYEWSPDGRWLAYAKTLRTDYSSIYVYDTKEKKVHQITGPTTRDYSPAWDPDGRYLYYISARSTNPVLGTRDWQNVEIRDTKPYLVLLRPDVKNPFAKLEGLPPKDDEKKDKKTNDKKKDEDKDEDEELKPIEIDFEGITYRTVEFPVKHGRYFGVGATSKKVFYISAPVRGFAEQGHMFGDAGPQNELISFDLDKKKPETFMDGMSTYALAAKKEKIAVMKKRGQIYVVDAGSKPSDLSEALVSMDGIVIELDPAEEWEQMYYEGWRHMRDFYWDEGMAGLNWQGIRDQYATLLPRLAARSDLNDLLGELIGELNTSHTYLWGGDPGVRVPSVSTGLLGADLVREGDSYRVERIYRGDPADNSRSPLLEPGVDVKEGDFIVAVNRSPFKSGRPFYASMENLAGKEVVLTVNDRPSRDGARDVVVKPLGGEHDIRYSDWVRRNREYVAEKTGGKIGYVHIPDMWAAGLIEFNTWFYPQLDKEGMVVDARWNGGGAVSQQILERFRRKLISLDRSRGGGIWTYPYRVLNGPFVVLTNEFAGSDGDIFPYAVQMEGLAPVIGMRSWGGVVGIRGDKQLVDGGMLTQPEFAWWDPERGWAMENHGVDPDIVVQNMPQELAQGIDAQLDRAIEEVMKLHEQNPPLVPDFGPVPERTREAYRRELRTSRD